MSSSIDKDENNPSSRIISIKAPLHKVIKPEFIKATVNLVDITNTIVKHTYAFIKYIFLKELEENDNYDLSLYINKKFFMEVFLSLVDRQERDDIKSGSGKSTLKGPTPQYREITKKHKASCKHRRARGTKNQDASKSIKSAERELCKYHSATLDLEKFIQCLNARKKVGPPLQEYYGNKTLTKAAPLYYPNTLDFEVEKNGDIYYGKRLLFVTCLHGARPGIANLDTFIYYLTLLLSTKHLKKRLTNQDIGNLNRIIKDATIWLNTEQPLEEDANAKLIQVKQQTHLIISRLFVLPFRRMKFTSKINYGKSDWKLANALRGKFGEDAVLIVGNWSAPNAKFQEPPKNKGLLRCLKKNGFPIYMLNEYKTSTCCPACKIGEIWKPSKKFQTQDHFKEKIILL